jgi:hypothetical protein
MLKRQELEEKIQKAIRRSPVTALLGPRQCGKTTLARRIAEAGAEYFDLESPADQARLQNPQLVLEGLKGLVILDEIQRMPSLMPLLRVLADRKPLPARFLILGSASPDLIKNSSESLAGRVEFVDMAGFSVDEVGLGDYERLWMRGGFPDSFLAGNDEHSWSWRENFIRTFLERDLPQLGVQIPSQVLRKFWTMVAHYHGQKWNGSEIAGSLGIGHATVRRHLDLLTGAFVIRQLPPWFENLGKRVVKSPKVFIRDSGLLHCLLNIPDKPALESHPKLGASWEGFVLEQLIGWAGERNAYFWGTHGGAELDLLLLVKGKRYGFEIKYSEAPATTKSMHVALGDLKLDRLWVVYPGNKSFAMDKKIECLSLKDMCGLKEELR